MLKQFIGNIKNDLKHLVIMVEEVAQAEDAL